jgi:hypothetical protein
MATEAVWVGGVHVQAADARVVRQAVCAQVTTLRCAVVKADGGGGLQLPEPMVEATCIHVWASCRALVWVMMLRRQT